MSEMFDTYFAYSHQSCIYLIKNTIKHGNIVKYYCNSELRI